MRDSKHFRNVYVVLKGSSFVPLVSFSSYRKALEAKERLLNETREADLRMDSMYDAYYESLFVIKRLTVL